MDILVIDQYKRGVYLYKNTPEMSKEEVDNWLVEKHGAGVSYILEDKITINTSEFEEKN
jgi:hypothetical protein